MKPTRQGINDSELLYLHRVHRVQSEASEGAMGWWCQLPMHQTGYGPAVEHIFYTYNDILNNAEAINVEVMMRMLKILWKETERKRVVEN